MSLFFPVFKYAVFPCDRADTPLPPVKNKLKNSCGNNQAQPTSPIWLVSPGDRPLNGRNSAPGGGSTLKEAEIVLLEQGTGLFAENSWEYGQTWMLWEKKIDWFVSFVEISSTKLEVGGWDYLWSLKYPLRMREDSLAPQRPWNYFPFYLDCLSQTCMEGGELAMR